MFSDSFLVSLRRLALFHGAHEPAREWALPPLSRVAAGSHCSFRGVSGCLSIARAASPPASWSPAGCSHAGGMGARWSDGYAKPPGYAGHASDTCWQYAIHAGATDATGATDAAGTPGNCFVLYFAKHRSVSAVPDVLTHLSTWRRPLSPQFQHNK